jgi:DNA-binding CsgD family transcriptional regulator
MICGWSVSLTLMAHMPTIAAQVSYELDGITTRAEFLNAAAEAVCALLPCDIVGWTSIDVPSQDAEAYVADDHLPPEVIEAIGRLIDVNPMWLSYHEHPEDLGPRRVSDLIGSREWRAHPLYAEVFRPLAMVHFATISVTATRNDSWMGWVLNRGGCDFTDEEMDLAARVQPVLIALNHASARAYGQAAPAAESGRAEAADRVGLTPRELRILELLAAGLTATAIGHACRISPRTVRKHLENVYAKLGCHDRLMAVRRAAELGLV